MKTFLLVLEVDPLHTGLAYERLPLHCTLMHRFQTDLSAQEVLDAVTPVQDYTPSEIRATTLSVITLASNLLLVPIGLFFGWITEHSNVFNAYLMVAILGLFYITSWL